MFGKNMAVVIHNHPSMHMHRHTQTHTHTLHTHTPPPSHTHTHTHTQTNTRTNKTKDTHAQLMRAFSAKFLGRYRYWKASLLGTGGLLARDDSMEPSNDRLCMEPGDRVPLKLL